MLGYRHSWIKKWICATFILLLIGIQGHVKAQMTTGTDTVFYDSGISSWEYYDFSEATSFTINDTASYDADFRGSSNEGASFGKEFTAQVLENRIILLGEGSLDTAVTVPEWVDGSPWVSDAWEATGYQPLETGYLWGVYTQEGTYAIVEFTELHTTWGEQYFVFNYKYQSDGSKNFDDADFGGSSDIVEGSVTVANGRGFDFSREEVADNHDAGDYQVDFVFVNNEGVNFGNEGSSSLSSTGRRFLLLGEGSIDDVSEVPARTDASPWVNVSYDWGDGTGGLPISVGELWAVYTREGNYAIMEITALPDGDFGTSFSFDYKYLNSGNRDFGGSGDFGEPEPEDDVVSIRELNTYDNLTEYDIDSLQSHPLIGELVTYTGVITSYPRSSGLASADDHDLDGTIDDVARIHVFIIDTAAVSQGRSGMSIQITESDWGLLEDFTIGDVATFEGSLGFFGATAQMTVESASLLGNVDSEYPEYASLKEPWEITPEDLNIANLDDTYEIDMENYTKYNGAYVKLSNTTVSDVVEGVRPQWAVNGTDSKVYIYDHSLRYRNDRNDNYLPSWNYRRSSEGNFVPPPNGSEVNVSGFVALVGYPKGDTAPNKDVFSISPFEDGLYWLDGIAQEGIEWPKDLEILSEPAPISIAEAIHTPSGETVYVKGIITRAKGAFSYLQQDTAATRIYASSGDYYNAVVSGELSQGDSVLITAERVDYENLLGLENVTSFEVFSEGNSLPVPAQLTMDELLANGFNYQSELIEVNSLLIPGSFSFSSASTHYAAQEGAEGIVDFYVPGEEDSEVGGLSVPSLFNYEGILGYYEPGTGAQLRPIESTDVIAVELPIPADSVYAPNGSFELSRLGETLGHSPGWFTEFGIETDAAGIFEIIDTDAQEGSNSLKVSIDSIAIDQESWRIQAVNEQFNLVPGEVYELSFWARSDQSGAVLNAQVQNPDYEVFGELYSDYANLTTIWEKYSTSFTAASNGVVSANDDLGRVAIFMNYPENEGKQIYIDNLEITPVDVGPIDGEVSILDVIGQLGEDLATTFIMNSSNGVPLESFQFIVNYDPELIDISIAEPNYSLPEDFMLESNSPEPGIIYVSASTSNPFTWVGYILDFQVTALRNGEGSIDITDIYLNETPENDISALVDISGRYCGDVTGDGNISATDASYVLRHTVKLSPQYPLAGEDSTAADVTGNGWISAYDASQILKFEVGLPAIMNCTPPAAKRAPLAAKVEWELTKTEEGQTNFRIPVVVKELQGVLTAAELAVPVTDGLEFKGLRNAPENWQVTTNKVEGTLYISLFGAKSLDGELLAELEFEVTDQTESQGIEGTIRINENEPVTLAKISLVEIPESFELSQNYPNPFNPTTQIKYSVPEEAKVQLIVFNLLGQKVAELVNDQKAPGRYTVSWDAENNSSGVYMYRLVSGDQVFTKKMLLIK